MFSNDSNIAFYGKTGLITVKLRYKLLLNLDTNDK